MDFGRLSKHSDVTPAAVRLPRPIPGSRREGRRPSTGDIARALLVAVLCISLMPLLEGQLSDQGHDFDGFAAALTGLSCAPIAYRQIFPATSASFALVFALLGVLIDYPMTGPLIVALGLVGLATSRTETRMPGTLGLFSGVVLAVVAASDPGDSSPVIVLIGGFAIGMLPALIGERLRAERKRTGDARELAMRVEQLRDRDIQKAVAEERLRIARDLHDITGHHLSAIALQAGGAGRTTSDGEATASFDRIHRLTVEALDQTKRSLGVLRQGSGPVGLVPSPRLAYAERLLAPAREAGIDVDLRIEGRKRELSETTEMCGYRVIQESITNVVRHAQATSVQIVVAYEDEALTITVEDDGSGGSNDPVRPGGGIEGMRERVALVEGVLEAGPRADGGWTVQATLPVRVPS